MHSLQSSLVEGWKYIIVYKFYTQVLEWLGKPSVIIFICYVILQSQICLVERSYSSEHEPLDVVQLHVFPLDVTD